MIKLELKEEARLFLDEKFRPFEAEIAAGLQKDDLWGHLALPIGQVRQEFFEHFHGRGELGLEILFDNLLNDFFLADKNYILCPIW